MPRHSANVVGPVERLTEDQRACLRGVLAHQTSKEIARHLGISPHTVDARIRSAIKLLDVETRREAALMLEKFEHQTDRQSLIYQPPSLNDAPSMHHTRGIVETAASDVIYPIPDEIEGEQSKNILNDAPASRWSSAEREGRQSRSWTPAQNQLGPMQRMMVILAISVGSALVVAMIALALLALETALV